MKIFVQGRKKGYCVLYPFPTPDEFYNFARDIQSINAKNQPFYYGKYLYSISFSQGGRIFSKYVLGYDVQRSNLGNISFSIFVSNKEILQGTSVLELLDYLTEKYFTTYAPNYFIKDIQENWSIFQTIANQYDTKLHSINQFDIEHIDRGTQDPAFIFYTTSKQLADYFDNPYQTAYPQFSQVLLVDAALKGKDENPLNVLKISPNADLSGQIDLENKKYRLVLNSGSKVTVERIQAGNRKSPIQQNDRIFKKDQICITWSESYHLPKEERGNIESLKGYLEIDEFNNTFSILPRLLQIQTKDIKLQFLLLGKSINIDNPKSTNSIGEEIQLKDGKFHFEGAQIDDKWTINTEKDFTNRVVISFHETFIPSECNSVLILKAKEKKELKFRFIDEETNIEVTSVEISFTNNNQKKQRISDSIIFTDKELDSKTQFEFRAKDYHRIPQYSITPREIDKNEIIIKLTPKPKRESTNEKQGYKFVWLKREILLPILFVLLLMSLTLNVVQCVQTSRHKTEIKNSATEIKNSAIAYVRGTELLSSTLGEYLKMDEIKGSFEDSLLSSARQFRDYIDNHQFQIEKWDTIYSNKASELKTFYKLCIENKNIVEQFQGHLNELWGKNIKYHPLREINDSLKCFIDNIHIIDGTLSTLLNEQEEGTGESINYATEEFKVNLGDEISSNDESNFWDKIKNIFSRKK